MRFRNVLRALGRTAGFVVDHEDSFRLDQQAVDGPGDHPPVRQSRGNRRFGQRSRAEQGRKAAVGDEVARNPRDGLALRNFSDSSLVLKPVQRRLLALLGCNRGQALE
jgi:hypothetical protein